MLSPPHYFNSTINLQRILYKESNHSFVQIEIKILLLFTQRYKSYPYHFSSHFSSSTYNFKRSLIFIKIMNTVGKEGSQFLRDEDRNKMSPKCAAVGYLERVHRIHSRAGKAQWKLMWSIQSGSSVCSAEYYLGKTTEAHHHSSVQCWAFLHVRKQ